MRKFRICFMTDEYFPETSWGGIATYVSGISKALAQLGNEIFIITAGKDSGYYTENNIRVFKIRARNIEPTSSMILKILSRAIFYIKVSIKFNELDKKYHFDIIQAPEARGVGVFLALMKNQRFITWLAMPAAILHRINTNNKLYNRIVSWLYEIPEMLQTKKSAKIISQTHFLADSLSKRWKISRDKFEIIPNGIDIDATVKLSGEDNMLNEKDYILYFGRLEINKGVGVLIKAMPKVLGLFPQQKIVIIGEDRGLKKSALGLKMKYPNNVIVGDKICQEKMLPIVRDARFVVLPSVLENISSACLESMVLGKVVVGTKGSGFEEALEDGKTGFLFPAGDANALVDKIKYCLALTNQQLDELGNNARKIAEERYDIRKIMEQTLSLYERLI